MDPNEALNRLRHALLDYRLAQDQENSMDAQTHAEDIADAAEVLDEWLSKGGFLPTSWEKLR